MGQAFKAGRCWCWLDGLWNVACVLFSFGGTGAGQPPWDSHDDIQEHRKLATECDQAIGALLTDLKQPLEAARRNPGDMGR